MPSHRVCIPSSDQTGKPEISVQFLKQNGIQLPRVILIARQIRLIDDVQT